jgi:hypothetical protein
MTFTVVENGERSIDALGNCLDIGGNTSPWEFLDGCVHTDRPIIAFLLEFVLRVRSRN